MDTWFEWFNETILNTDSASLFNTNPLDSSLCIIIGDNSLYHYRVIVIWVARPSSADCSFVLLVISEIHHFPAFATTRHIDGVPGWPLQRAECWSRLFFIFYSLFWAQLRKAGFFCGRAQGSLTNLAADQESGLPRLERVCLWLQDLDPLINPQAQWLLTLMPSDCSVCLSLVPCCSI